MLNKTREKYIAFTLAELMVIMSVMTVVLAAVAPIFTSRYTNASLDNVWELLTAGNNNDIFTDAPSKAMMQEVLIGITPVDMEEIRNTFKPFSKLVIRSSDRVSNTVGTVKQKQIEFKYGNNTQGFLFAANTNILLGGNYNNINFDYAAPNLNNMYLMNVGEGAVGNTAVGIDALDSITNGKYNSAFGYKALNKLTTGIANTAVGYAAASNLTTGTGNVFIGYNSYNAADGDYNTIIGQNSGSRSSSSNRTTAIGNEINVKGNYNTAIGHYSNAGGNYNTAIGYAALSSSNPDSDSYSNFEYNTAIGYKACSGISSNAKNKTCIGGHGIDNSVMSSTAISLFNDQVERIFIGEPTSKYNSAATLEVHNPTTTQASYPYPGSSGSGALGDASVIVNGNLIVRGQTYMIGRSPFPLAPSSSKTAYANTISLMGYRLYKESPATHKPLIGFDGSEYMHNLFDANGNLHQETSGREHCICAYSCSSSKDYNGGRGYYGRDSYEWSYYRSDSSAEVYSSPFVNNANYIWGFTSPRCSAAQDAGAFDANVIEFDRAHNMTYADSDSSSIEQYLGGGSCCPILTPVGSRRVETIENMESTTSSDARLKNIGKPFNEGFEYLSKLKIFNYTFKSDKFQAPHVGVIAQNLKNIFPNAVTKDDKGYYQIRWDEMFYSAINSIKELNTKVVQLFKRVENNVDRVVTLKKENQYLKQKLIELAGELDKLEK